MWVYGLGFRGMCVVFGRGFWEPMGGSMAVGG